MPKYIYWYFQTIPKPRASIAWFCLLWHGLIFRGQAQDHRIEAGSTACTGQSIRIPDPQFVHCAALQTCNGSHMWQTTGPSSNNHGGLVAHRPAKPTLRERNIEQHCALCARDRNGRGLPAGMCPNHRVELLPTANKRAKTTWALN